MASDHRFRRLDQKGERDAAVGVPPTAASNQAIGAAGDHHSPMVTAEIDRGCQPRSGAADYERIHRSPIPFAHGLRNVSSNTICAAHELGPIDLKPT